MLGWYIIIYKQNPPQTNPPTSDNEEGAEIARWEADLWGLKWIKELVSNGNAKELGGNGYPFLYTAKLKHLLPILQSTPPHKDNWSKLEINQGLVSDTLNNEWLIIEAWDQS